MALAHVQMLHTSDMVAWDCNCSVCSMRRNVHTMVPKERFRLTQGSDALTQYTVRPSVYANAPKRNGVLHAGTTKLCTCPHPGSVWHTSSQTSVLQVRHC
jgi:hypothetical protein